MRLIKNCIIAIFLLFVFSCSGKQKEDRELAKRILADKTLDTVYSKASVLLAKGFTAGDGYPQVWIRDLNTFIETACEVYDPQVIREKLLVFFTMQQPDSQIVDGYVLKGHEEAYESVRPMLDRVIVNDKFYEWYGIDGKPNGSGDFRGEAGVLAKAVIMLQHWAENN